MQWNDFDTGSYQGQIAETTKIKGYNGDYVTAYVARPLGAGPFPGIVLIHHMPGWDEFYRETARRFAHHGYITVCPDLYVRAGTGKPDDVTAKIRGEGGVADDSVVGDCEGALDFIRALPNASGKVGIIGTCSGGRNSYLTAARTQKFDAIANLWGGRVTANADELTPQQPVAPIDYTAQLNCPVLGIFGNEDQSPTPEQVNTLEEALKTHGKQYEFHRYDGAGHGFFYYDRPNYRQQQAMDGWSKVFEFFGRTLG
ncbi:MAG: dienelactone hydrolase family protein [Chloroflexota bacterium]